MLKPSKYVYAQLQENKQNINKRKKVMTKNLYEFSLNKGINPNINNKHKGV